MPASVRRLLSRRKTQIVAFELLAAVVAVICLCPQDLAGSSVVHYIDNTPALSCIVKASSKKTDLNFISGRLWFEAGCLMAHYRAEYVKSACNLADGPSRNNVDLLKSLEATELEWTFPRFKGGLDGWMSCPLEVDRLVV